MAQLKNAVTKLIKQARTHYSRHLVVLAGDHAWTLEQAGLIQQWVAPERPLWIAETAPEGAEKSTPRMLHRYLGTECDMLVFDARCGFNPNGFGQISGTLRGGGLLLLLTPDLEQWPAFDDPEHKSLAVEPYGTERVGRRFVQRLIGVIRNAPDTLLVTPDGIEHMPSRKAPPPATQHPSETVAPYATPEQAQAVAAVIKHLSRGRRPLVITADRGRGKSAALGIAAAQLIAKGVEQIWVTAPALESVSEVFRHAAAHLPNAVVEKGALWHGLSTLSYITPDELVRSDGAGVTLLVDEAAAIPVPVLTRLLDRFSRIVFASTVHGYEGTGKGFAVRFRKELERRTPNWRAIELKQPVRWTEGDPLEQFVFDALMLDAEPISEAGAQALEAEPLQIERVDRDRLLEDNVLLSELFGLLVLAHYRTTPGDLRILLDSPNLNLWVARCRSHVVGAALVAEEGALEPDLAQAVWAGKRRPKGHLLPQTLIGQEGYIEAAPLRCGRIMRIAVHPFLQRKGIARQLLQAISDFGNEQGWDYLGSSFGATEDLLLFWQNSGFGAIRLGESRDPVSGTHAAIVCRSLSYQGRLMFNHLRDRFTQQLPLLLGYNLRDLEVEVLPMLLQGMRFDTELSSHDRRDLEAFVNHNRSYESCIVPIRKLVIRSLKNSAVWHALSPEELSLLVSKALQQRSWEEIDPHAGRRALMRRMRTLVGDCLRL